MKYPDAWAPRFLYAAQELSNSFVAFATENGTVTGLPLPSAAFIAALRLSGAAGPYHPLGATGLVLS